MKLLQLRCSEAISIFKDAIKMAPSIDKEASGAGEQDAEGEDGAVRGPRSQVTGSVRCAGQSPAAWFGRRARSLPY